MHLAIKDLLAWADKNNPKKELNYIYIDRAAMALVATNTSVMIKVQFTCNDDFERALVAPIAPREENYNTDVINHDGHITGILGKYPDYQRIIVENIENRTDFKKCIGGVAGRDFYREGVIFDWYSKNLQKPLKQLLESELDAYVRDVHNPVHFSGDADFIVSNKSTVKVKINAAVMPFYLKD